MVLKFAAIMLLLFVSTVEALAGYKSNYSDWKQTSPEAQSQYAMAYCVATVYAGLGDKDKAFAELDRSFAQREWWLTRLKVDPLMDSLRDDPRFAAMLERSIFRSEPSGRAADPVLH